MLEFIGGLLLEVVEFFVGLSIVRDFKRWRGRPERPLSEDAGQLAMIEWILLPIAGVIAVLIGLGMYAAGVPGFWCFAAPIAGLLCFAFVQYRRRMDL